MQEARHVRIQGLPGAGEEARLGGAEGRVYHAVECAERAVQPGRAAGAAAVHGARGGHGALPHHRERGLRGGGARRHQPLVRARRAHAGAPARHARPLSVVYKRSLDVLWET